MKIMVSLEWNVLNFIDIFTNLLVTNNDYSYTIYCIVAQLTPTPLAQMEY